MKRLTKSRIDKFLDIITRNRLNLHSLLIWHKGQLVYEAYRAPYTADTPQRMYSTTKSFVSIAIGALLDEGKISLDDPIVKYFSDKLPEGEISWELREQTIRDMLRMQTCFPEIGNWFKPEVRDRTIYYYRKPIRPAGTLFLL